MKKDLLYGTLNSAGCYVAAWIHVYPFGPITSWEIDGETMETVSDFIFWAPKSLQMVIAAMKLKDTPWKESYDQPRQHIKKQRHYFANKGPSSQGYGFSICHVWM